MFLRQIALVARDLDAATQEVTRTLGVEVAYRDPGVKIFGLRNVVMPVGDTFLEIVSPVADDAPAARYLERHGSDGGYMVMLQSADLDADRARLERLGVRTVWSAELDDIRSVHLHPKDTGGAILSLDTPTPAEAWRWAGPDWRDHVRTDRARRLLGAELAAPDPEALARRWSEVLDLPVAGRHAGECEIPLAPGMLRFVPGERERLMGIDVEAADPTQAGRRSDAVGIAIHWV